MQAILEIPFSLESIAPAAAPDGSEGVWHRYVISQEGSNTITGVRSGTRTEVDIQLNDMVAQLNERFGKNQAKLKR